MTSRPTAGSSAATLIGSGTTPTSRMIVLNSGDQITEAAAAQLGRAVWRYRSELTPLALMALVVLTAYCRPG